MKLAVRQVWYHKNDPHVYHSEGPSNPNDPLKEVHCHKAPGSPYAQKIKITPRETSIAFVAELPESLDTGRTNGLFGTDDPRPGIPLLRHRGIH